MSSSRQHQTLDRVLRAWLDGKVGQATFVTRVFENLTSDNLHIFLRLVSSDDLEMLKSVAASAPTTEQGWDSVLVMQSWCAPSARDPEQKQREDKQTAARYRRGVETLRQSLE